MTDKTIELYIDQEDLVKLSSIAMECASEIKPGVLDYVQLQNAMVVLALGKLQRQLGMDVRITLHEDLLNGKN